MQLWALVTEMPNDATKTSAINTCAFSPKRL